MIVQELVTKLSFASAPGVASAQKAFHSVYQAAAKSARQQQAAQQRAALMAQRAVERSAAAQQRANERAARAAERAAERAAKAQVRAAEKAAMAAERSAAKRAKAESAFMGKGMGVIGSGVMAGGILAAGVVAKGTEALGEYQTGLMRLRVEYGNAATAGAKYAELVKFAARTPFELPEVVNAFAQLKAQGFNIGENELTALGDLASASGKSLEELVNTMLSAKRGHADMVDNFVGLGAKMKGGMMTATMFDKNTGKDIEYKIDPKDKVALLKFFTDAGKRKGISGMMGEQSKTIPGQLSTMTDEMKMLLVAGFKPLEGSISKGFVALSNFMKQMKPLAIQTGLFVKNNMPGVLKAIHAGFKLIQAALPLVVTALGLFIARWTQLKAMALITWLTNTATAIKAVGVAQWFTNAAIGFIPTLIIGAIAAIALFAADTVNYFKTGKSVILDYTKQWPWLHNAIKWVMETAITWFLALYEGIKKGIDYWMPLLSEAFNSWKDTWVGIFNLVKPQFEMLLNIIGQIGNAAGSAFNAVAGLFNANSGGGGGGAGMPVGSDGTKFTVNGKTYTKDQNLANRLTQVGAGMYSGAKMCLRGVWMTQQAVLRGTSQIRASHAYMAADQLAKDRRFQEITVTPEMYKRAMAGDKQMQALLNGATVIYNRGAGFSPTAGHAEIWDTYKQKAYYGMGSTSMRRSDQMIQNARVFIPTSGQAASAPVITNNVTVQVAGQAPSAGQIGDAAAKGAADGTTKGLQRLKTTTRAPARPR